MRVDQSFAKPFGSRNILAVIGVQTIECVTLWMDKGLEMLCKLSLVYDLFIYSLSYIRLYFVNYTEIKCYAITHSEFEPGHLGGKQELYY